MITNRGCACFTPKMVKSVLKTRVSEIRVIQIHVIQNLGVLTKFRRSSDWCFEVIEAFQAIFFRMVIKRYRRGWCTDFPIAMTTWQRF